MKKNDGYMQQYIEKLTNTKFDEIDALIAAEQDIAFDAIENEELTNLIMLGEYLFLHKLMTDDTLYKCHQYCLNNAPIYPQELKVYQSLLLSQVFTIINHKSGKQ